MKRAGSGFSRLLELWREASGATSGGGGLSQGNAGLASWLTALSSLPAANSLPAWSADLDLAALEAAAANNPELQVRGRRLGRRRACARLWVMRRCGAVPASNTQPAPCAWAKALVVKAAAVVADRL